MAAISTCLCIHTKKIIFVLGCAQWYMPVIPALGRLRQEDGEFGVSLSCIERLYHTKGKKIRKEDNMSYIHLVSSVGCFALTKS